MSELRMINIDRVIDSALVKLDEAEKALDSIKETAILTAYANYQHEMGMFYAYMDILKSAKLAMYIKVAEECHDRIDLITDKSEKLYRHLKDMCR